MVKKSADFSYFSPSVIPNQSVPDPLTFPSYHLVQFFIFAPFCAKKTFCVLFPEIYFPAGLISKQNILNISLLVDRDFLKAMIAW